MPSEPFNPFVLLAYPSQPLISSPNQLARDCQRGLSSCWGWGLKVGLSGFGNGVNPLFSLSVCIVSPFGLTVQRLRTGTVSPFGLTMQKVLGTCGVNGLMGLDREGYGVMTGADAERQEITQKNVVSGKINSNVHVNTKGGGNVSSFDMEMPVPFHENDILNPSKESVNVGSNVSNVGQRKESNENVSWPSLNENGSNAWNKKAVGNEVGSSNDTIMEDGNERRPTSFVNVFQGISGNGSNKLVRVPVKVNDQGREVVVMDPVVEEGSKKWDLTLVRYFVGLKMGYYEISGHLKRMWISHQLAEIITNDCGLYFLKFRSLEGMNFVLENGPWLVDSKPFFVKKWEAGMCMEKPKPDKVPLWVKIMNVPLEAWNAQGISRIASRIGNPIIMDRITTSMCDRAYGRASFARVLIEVDASKELVESVEICYEKLGKSMNLRVEYAWKPSLCTHCKVFGHEYRRCGNRVLTDEEKVEQAKINVQSATNVDEKNKAGEEWQEVRRPARYRASTSRGGNQQGNGMGYGYGYRNRGSFNRRGRGGMNGRGGIYQMSGVSGDNGRFVPVKNVMQNVDEVQVLMGDNVAGRKDKGKAVFKSNDRLKKQAVKQNVINIKNSFNALVEEIVEEGDDEWIQEKSKIDLACDLGMKITEGEKKRWSKDLRKYYDDKCAVKAKDNLVEGLKWRISKLQKDISYGHNNVAMLANTKANESCKEIMKETRMTHNQAYLKVYDEIYRDELNKIKEWVGEKQLAEVELFFLSEQVLTDEVRNSWTEEMIAKFKGLVGERVDDMIKKQFEENMMECMNDEVAEETHGSYAFLVKSRCGGRHIYVSYVYGENGVKERLSLWRNLIDHKGMIGDVPWVMLGDFNVILYQNESSNSYNVKGVGMQDFKECVDNLNMGDVNMNGMFFTWIQKRKDPREGVLKKLDRNWNITVRGYKMFILAKKLKYMKKHLRSLNKKNGNVFNKVRFLKTELERVQSSLDRDPLSANLREEEMVYVSAYKEDCIDEERVLKQKSKIEWLREGDFNSAFFHNMVKGKITKNRIDEVKDEQGNTFSGRDVAAKFVDHFKNIFTMVDDIYPIEDPSNVFTRRLEPEVVVYLIRPVSDEEIKVALLDIDDNKASSPDGFTSKFFKAAWKVVGEDTCGAVKEFFTSRKLLGEFNTTLISLIPKTKTPIKFFDYRPISCCNVVYKIISKVLTDRIKTVLNDLVDVNQSAFILVKAEKRFQYHWGCKELNITSLCFTDDLLMLCHGDFISASVLRRGLDEFGMSSGLYPNMSKSEAFFSNIPDNVIADIKLVMSFTKRKSAH
ncbi:RNA-directed DNA polymerase, eukaryota, reverse transcriptase zinc-binding domain protein [Tanacetum coccineum]